ncbi:hypothetical protein [Methylobacterium komagatae]
MANEDTKPGTGAVDSPLDANRPHHVSETATSDPTGRMAAGGMADNMPDGAMSTAAPGEAPDPLLQSEADRPLTEEGAEEREDVNAKKAATRGDKD